MRRLCPWNRVDARADSLLRIGLSLLAYAVFMGVGFAGTYELVFNVERPVLVGIFFGVAMGGVAAYEVIRQRR